MIKKNELEEWILTALREQGGESHLVEVAKHIWNHHEDELRASGDLFYTWQYDMRWAAQNLKNSGKLLKLPRSWRLTK